MTRIEEEDDTQEDELPSALIDILKEMFKRVEADFSKQFIKNESWFTRYSWTEEEQEDFEEWLVHFLHTNSQARKDILQIPGRTSKKHLKKAAQEFTFMYGWRLKHNPIFID